MESISVETDWDGLALSSLLAAGRNNLSSSSLLVSELNSLNSSHSGGSFFGIYPENGSTTTQHTLPQPQRDLGLARAEIAVLGVVLALTTLGNSFVLWVLLRRRKHNAPMHVFMFNLCVADLVVAFFQVLPQLIWDITGKFQGPDFLCRSVKYLQIVGLQRGTMSRWNTPVMVAWGLALVLSIPQAFIFSRTETVSGEFDCWGHFAEPWGLKAYVTWMTVSVFLLPAFIITICQIRIFREIHNNIYLKSERIVMAELKKKEIFFRFHSFKKDEERSRDRGRRSSGGGARDGRGGQPQKGVNNNPHNNTHDSQAGECYDFVPSAVQYSSSGEHVTTTSPQQQTLSGSDCQDSYTPYELASGSPRCSLDYARPPLPATPPHHSITKAMSKTVRMTLVIVLVYTICWAPYFTVQLWAAWDPHPPEHAVAFTILMLLGNLNSCTNPWIYTAFSSSVSRELQNLLQCRTRPGRRGSLPDDSTTTHTSTTKDSLY
ncbi:Vasopressin V2 receptor [Dissostichus eleginoides]|uniref:Vasopressin V2 receptor n=1 Tax=Dissostichus eleginoides TaxID=100907 RepID=A0AAD9C9C1_DISEL|nr:Vasopressin V2 receptor [Dissostichus eleginoides]